MADSRFLYDAIYHRLSIESQEYFDERAPSCFTSDSNQSWIDVYTDSHTLGKSALVRKCQTQNEGANALRVIHQESFTVRIEHVEELRNLFFEDKPASVMCFVRQRNTLSRLNIERALFSELIKLSACSPRAYDFVLCFGLRNGETDVTPPSMFSNIEAGKNVSHDLMSSIQMESTYLLRFVEHNHRPSGNPWSIRQTGVLHTARGPRWSSNWIFLAISPQAQAQLENYVTALPETNDIDVFTVHFILIDTAVWGWRRYILYLSNEIRKQGDRAVLADFEAGETNSSKLEERQYIKQLEDAVIEAMTSINFMLDNIDAMRKFHEAYQIQTSQLGPPTMDQLRAVEIFPEGLATRRRSLQLYLSQLDSLYKNVQGVSSLVSNILELENGNALKVLGYETRIENASMAILTKRSVEDASSVKILTIVTLVYLPVTVVTNFFSTVFVAQSDDDGPHRLNVVSNVWILAAVSVPLTLITIYLWYSFAWREIHGSFPRWIVALWKYLMIPKTILSKRRG